MEYFWVVLVAVLLLARKLYLDWNHSRIYWVWDNGADGKMMPKVRIPQRVEEFSWPKGFLWGTATAAHQIEGHHTTNNWAEFEKREGAIHNGDKCGASCDHWNRVAEDVKLMKDIHMNAYRFSLSWSKIQPEEGKFDQSAIQHYHDEIDLLLKNGIAPMITLHHFTEPLWFANKGGFTKEENVSYFITFSERVFSEYQSKVDFWCTFNEPAVYTVGGWVDGCFPPGEKDNAVVAGKTLGIILAAHTKTYHALKKLARRETIQVGIVKNIFHIDPHSPLNPFDRALAWLLDDAFNGVVLRYLSSGSYSFRFPGASSSRPHDPLASSSYDFLGLNYYSQYLVKFTLSRSMFQFLHRDGSIKSDMPQSIYPEGLHRALVRISKVNKCVPVYVTENGIADDMDDRRHLWIRRHLVAVHRAIQDGIDVRGFFYWSLLDNFEWAEGYSMRFGLYAVDFETQQRTLRDGSKVFAETARRAQLADA